MEQARSTGTGPGRHRRARRRQEPGWVGSYARCVSPSVASDVHCGDTAVRVVRYWPEQPVFPILAASCAAAAAGALESGRQGGGCRVPAPRGANQCFDDEPGLPGRGLLQEGVQRHRGPVRGTPLPERRRGGPPGGRTPGRLSSRRCAAPAPGAAPASNRLAGPGVDHLGVTTAADCPGLAAGPGGRGRHRGRRPACPLPPRPAAPGRPRVPRGRAQTRRDPRCPEQGSAERKGHQAARRGHPRLPARGRRRTLATLLTEAAGPLGRRDHAALRTLSGVAPVTKRSGKTRFVVMRHAAQVRLRQAVFHWAGRPC